MEPFFSTAKLTPLIGWIQDTLRTIPNDAAAALWCREIFGLTDHGVEDRSYSAVLSPGRPLIAIVGDPRIPGDPLPSLTDETDRARLRSVGARLVETASNHSVPLDVMREALRQSLTKCAMAKP